jgi:hypothetical protein
MNLKPTKKLNTEFLLCYVRDPLPIKFFYYYSQWGETESYQPRMIGDGDCVRNCWNEDWQGKPKYSEKACTSAALTTTNPTWLHPGLNLDRGRGGKPATNRLSYGAAYLLPEAQSHSQPTIEIPLHNVSEDGLVSVFRTRHGCQHDAVSQTWPCHKK